MLPAVRRDGINMAMIVSQYTYFINYEICCSHASDPALSLFDHLVGKVEHGQRDREAQRLGGFEVDDQLVLGRLLDREIGRTGALEDAVDVGCGLGERGD